MGERGRRGVAATLALTLALAGCGGGDDDGGASSTADFKRDYHSFTTTPSDQERA